MKVMCDFCGNFIDDTDNVCPCCGETKTCEHQKVDMIPQTIEELEEWYIAHNLPSPEITRFFIGQNVFDKKAFGIYKDFNGDFVVYKNKIDGTRVIRYQGKDEAFAVKELYLRLKEEIWNQKGINYSKQNRKPSPSIFGYRLAEIFVIVVVVAVIFMVALWIGKHPDDGYYMYEDDYYYYQDDWYIYDDYYGWVEVDDVDSELYDHYHQYETDYYEYDWGIDSFESSIYYDPAADDDWDWDSDDDWDWDSGDSWDSGGTDWDSDW